jgi:hypothetical protein
MANRPSTPNALTRTTFRNTSRRSLRLANASKEVERALPRSKGGETPLQLQTYVTEAYTYFTQADGKSHLLYSAENWVKIKLELETAGPVAVGTAANITPVLGGRGILLDDDELYEVVLPRGTRFYITSEATNRVSVTIEPIPWLEQLDADTVASLAGVQVAINQMNDNLMAALGTLSQNLGGQGVASAPVPAPTPRPIPASGGVVPRLLPRLTPMAPPRKMRR